MSAQVRFWRWRRNPLRRSSDVAEAWIGVATVVSVMAVAPLAGAMTAASTDAHLLRQEQGWHRTTAVLTQDAAPVTSAVAAGADIGQVRALVRWTAPDHSVHTAMAQVAPGAKAGSATGIWTDGNGALRRQPLSQDQAALVSDLAGASVAAGVSVLLFGGRRVVIRTLLDRRRAQDWERAWAEVEPRWTHGHA